ncbi:MAG: restriction endonuclease subunit S, partial [Campylobacter sp.]|nr:restriction endonuclease subunit S [Campylobacter sp.]
MQIATHLLKNLNCEWREFALTELFTYERGTRLTKNDRINGKYPLVTAGEYNKGVKEYISNLNQKVFKNAITIDMFCNSFVHIDEFCCDDNVLVLTSKTPISKETMIFISSIINKDKDKWGYEKQYRQNSL